MRYQIDLHEARLLLIPLGKGANRDLLFQQCSWLCASTTTQLIFASFWSQQTINASGADASQFRFRLTIAAELIVTLKHGYQLRQHGLQALAADVIHDAPQFDQCYL